MRQIWPILSYILGLSDPMVKPLPCMVSPLFGLRSWEIDHQSHVILALVLNISSNPQADQNNHLALISIPLFLVIFPCAQLIKKGKEIHSRGLKLVLVTLSCP